MRSSPKLWSRTSSRKRDLVDDLEVARQHGRTAASQHSSASGSSVWFVYAIVRQVMSHAVSRIAYVDEQPHELRHGDRGMRVVELHRELLMEPLERNPYAQYPEHVLQRARDEEILLLEPQLLAARLVVVRVEDFAQVLRDDLLIDGAVVVAAVEDREVERVGRPRRARGAAC